jgi:hypothetical protein
MPPTEANPCCPPRASDTFYDGGFPWWILPVVLLYLYGGCFVVLGVTTVFMLLCGCSMSLDRNHSASNAQAWGIMLWHVLISVHGCLAIISGHSLWKRRWRRALVFLAGAVGVVVLLAVTMYIVLILPPGPELRSVPTRTAMRSLDVLKLPTHSTPDAGT